MKIAFTSFEYPPDTGGGGIGTYLFSIRKYLAEAGHDVYVFCGTSKNEVYEEVRGVIRIPSTDWNEFNIQVVRVFEEYHNRLGFDILEGTDFQACGKEIKKTFPQLPYIVRLHTPNFFSDQLNFQPLSYTSKIRFLLGGVLKGKLFHLPSKKDIPLRYPHEFENLKLADAVLSPSKTIYKILREHLPENHTAGFVAFPFNCDIGNSITAQATKGPIKIVFAGRLEKRKGIIEMVEAVRRIRSSAIEFEVLIAGKSSESPVKGLSMQRYLLEEYVRPYNLPITFLGKLSYNETQDLLQKADIFVFPSYWESFGMVVFEAMSYGTAVICTAGSAPAEFISAGSTGLIVEPRNVASLTRAILALCKDEELRKNLGTAAKAYIKRKFDPARIVEEQVSFYKQVIESMKYISKTQQ